jgi:hypothetical protein
MTLPWWRKKRRNKSAAAKAPIVTCRRWRRGIATTTAGHTR